MLVPFVTPFYITASIFAVVLFVIGRKYRNGKAVIALLAAIILFIPSCTSVMFVVDQFRYGRFDYESVSVIPKGSYIELPETAVDITLYKFGTGHKAKFSVSTDILLKWVDDMRALRPELNSHWAEQDDEDSSISELMRKETAQYEADIFLKRFSGTDWEYDPTMRKYEVSRSDRGGGFTVWHVPSDGDTYLETGYW